MTAVTGRRTRDWLPALCLMVATAACWVAAYCWVRSYENRRWAERYPQPVPDVPATSSRFAPAYAEDGDGLTWTADLEAAMAWAMEIDVLVLLEFAAQCDVNGHLNHHAAFNDPAIRAELRRFVRVVLYVDGPPRPGYKQPPTDEQQKADGLANALFQTTRFNTIEIPMYVVLRPKGGGRFDVVREYRGSIIRDHAEFAAWLRSARLAAR